MIFVSFLIPDVLVYFTVNKMNELIGNWLMVFNSILVISWQSVLLVEEIGVPTENRQPAASHGQTLSHNIVSSTLCLSGVRTHNISSDSH